MTVGELIKKLEEYPEQIGVRFEAEVPGTLKSLLAIKDIKFDTESNPEEPLCLQIELEEVGKIL